MLYVHGLMCDNDNAPVEFSFLSNQTCSGTHVKGTLSAIANCMPRLRVLRLPLPNGIELTEVFIDTHIKLHFNGSVGRLIVKV